MVVVSRTPVAAGVQIPPSLYEGTALLVDIAFDKKVSVLNPVSRGAAVPSGTIPDLNASVMH